MADIQRNRDTDFVRGDNRANSTTLTVTVVTILLVVAVLGLMFWSPAPTTTPIMRDPASSSSTVKPLSAPAPSTTTVPQNTAPQTTPLTQP